MAEPADGRGEAEPPSPGFASPRRDARWLCLVTDRRRLTTALAGGVATSVDLLCEQVAGAIRGGVDLIQIREPDLDGRALGDLIRRVAALDRPRSVRIVVNERADVALAAGADGVHLREAGLPIARVRALSPSGFLIGRSVHSQDGARQAREADYLIAGHVFETVSKPGSLPPLGLHGLRDIVQAAGRTPVLAIGGITVDAVAPLVEAGAAGAAAIGAFIPPGPVRDVVTAVQKLTQDLRIAFDRHESVP